MVKKKKLNKLKTNFDITLAIYILVWLARLVDLNGINCSAYNFGVFGIVTV